MNYWEKFYKVRTTPEPSDFAKFVENHFGAIDKVVDIGAGDFRDSTFLGELCNKLVAIEPNNVTNFENFEHKKITAEQFFSTNKDLFDIGYARWFIHAVEKPVENSFVNWASKHCEYVAIESRALGDTSFENDHYRRLINPNELMKKLIEKGFNIDYFKCDYGMSRVGNDDPLLFRIIATNSLIQNIKDAKNIAEDNGIDLILDGGSLLGAYRDKGAIKNDYDDIDFVAFYKDWDKAEQMIADFEEWGFSVVRKRETMFSVAKGNSKIDIFFVREDEENYYITLYWRKRPFGLFIPKRFFDELGEIEFYHTKFKCPKDIEGYLTHRYGDWRTPIIRPAFTFQNYIDTPGLTRYLDI